MKSKGILTGIISNLIIIETEDKVLQNEICFVRHGNESLLAEVIRISGKNKYAQVFENTRGLKVGSQVDFTGELLEVTLGPGMLSKIYDGLQNDLYKMDGLLLNRGQYNKPFDPEQLWEFKPLVKVGDIVKAGDWIGEVSEKWLKHKIMVPFYYENLDATVTSIVKEGMYQAKDTVAVITDSEGNDYSVTMKFKWPVKKPVRIYQKKVRPYKIMETGVRVIDIFNPMVEGGTGFIPGPFGCGKTVLQHAISKYADADLILVVACGERANEVVELFTEFPELDDPRTGRKLMERTIIICNTSNMPVASREASVYTGMSMAEYYRSMGLKVLVLADSTSRWAQALREMSNRMEELPGPDAYPMDLSAIVANYYSRAGHVVLNNGKTGSITFMGTVSPAGGNLKEPVTEATKKVAQAFYALSQQRADSKRYPAIDSIASYSKYLEYNEIKHFLNHTYEKSWTEKVQKLRNLLNHGKEIRDQINILGDDGVPLDYHQIFWKSELIDFTLLQQDSFDDIDASTPIERQKYMLNLILNIVVINFKFDNFEIIADYFKKIIDMVKQMNYSEFKGSNFLNFQNDLNKLIMENQPDEAKSLTENLY